MRSSASVQSPNVLERRLSAGSGSEMVGFDLNKAGSVARGVSDKLSDTISVFDFMTEAERADVRSNTGSIDVTTKIQAAIDSLNNGGRVFFPSGKYRTTDNIKMANNIYLFGTGYGTHVRNEATTGFSKCTFISGNIGDIANLNGIYQETAYNLQAIAKGEINLAFVTPSDGSNFVVGDIVVITSYEKYPLAPPDDTAMYHNTNEVSAVSGGVITLKYKIPDTYPSSVGNPQIRRITGSFNGYGGTPMWAAKNCGITNMRITQATGLTSGWYALFPCGVNQTYRNLWLDDCSSLVGTNGLGYAIFKNISGRFEAGFLDFADFQNNLYLENVHGTRFAANASLNRIGLSFNSGTDIYAKKVTANLGFGGIGYGRFSLYKVHRGVFDACEVIDAGSPEAVLLGRGTNCDLRNSSVINPFQHPVVIVGEGHKVIGNRLPDVGAAGKSVYIDSNIDEYEVSCNVMGTPSNRTIEHTVYQNIATSVNSKIYDNIEYNETKFIPAIAKDALFSQTNSLVLDTIKTANISGKTGIERGYRIMAYGTRSGVAGTKDIELFLGPTKIGSVVYAAPETGNWKLEAEILVTTGDAVRCSSIGIRSLDIVSNDITLIADGMVGDTEITLQAKVGHSADTVAVYQFVVEPL